MPCSKDRALNAICLHEGVTAVTALIRYKHSPFALIIVSHPGSTPKRLCTMATTWLITSRLSPFSSSLLSSSPSPSQLPALPTLSQLQKYAEDAKDVVTSSAPDYFQSGTIASVEGKETGTGGRGTGNGLGMAKQVERPAKAVPISKSVRQPVRPWSRSPPPLYTVTDPRQDQSEAAAEACDDRGRKLKKGRERWIRVQGYIPGEEPKMEPSRGYTGGQIVRCVQEGVEDGEGEKEKKWVKWYVPSLLASSD